MVSIGLFTLSPRLLELELELELEFTRVYVHTPKEGCSEG